MGKIANSPIFRIKRMDLSCFLIQVEVLYGMLMIVVMTSCESINLDAK